MVPVDPLVAYVLMRTDLPDYLPGKSMAQAHHAGVKMMVDLISMAASNPRAKDIMLEYAQEADGFGTTIVLGVTYREMRDALEHAALLTDDAIVGLIHDPSYPVRDGDQVNHMPVDTCGYVFGRKSPIEPVLGRFPLFRD